jgi:hypothetical protein
MCVQPATPIGGFLALPRNTLMETQTIMRLPIVFRLNISCLKAQMNNPPIGQKVSRSTATPARGSCCNWMNRTRASVPSLGYLRGRYRPWG